MSMLALAHTMYALLSHRSDLSLPVAGAGVVFLASGLILLCSGALAELIYSRGDMRDSEFIRLTQDVRPRGDAA